MVQEFTDTQSPQDLQIASDVLYTALVINRLRAQASSALHEGSPSFSIWLQPSVSESALAGLEGALETFLCPVSNLTWRRALAKRADGESTV